MRHSIRHPSDIPIEISTDELAEDQREAMNDISFGG
ncbi:MAG TPA: PilZ domain-containing protein, partial [Candidatus Tenderia sp.]|nr:PilZ domain-containing protein [Candidatus Tenderia sp.]